MKRLQPLTTLCTIALAAISHAAPANMTITRDQAGIVIRGPDWAWHIGADGRLGKLVRQGRTLISAGSAWYETEAGNGSQRPTAGGIVTVEQREADAVATIKTVVDAGKGKAHFDLEQRITAGALPGYPDGAVMLEYLFKQRDVRLRRSALAISWPVQSHKGKLYWLEGLNRYNVEPRTRSHSIFTGRVRYMKLVADAPSVAIVPLDYSSFQFQDNRRFGSQNYSCNVYSTGTIVAAVVPPGCRIDPAKTAPEPADIPSEFGNLVIRAPQTWAEKAPAEGITVPRGREARQLVLPGLLHGIRNHADLHAPLKLHVDYRKAGAFGVQLDSHSGWGGANMLIYLDGKLMLRRDFVDKTERTMYRSSGLYKIDVPGGKHTIIVDNDGADWLRVASYAFINYGAERLSPPPSPTDYAGRYQRVAFADMGADDAAFVVSADDWCPKDKMRGRPVRKVLGRSAHNNKPQLRLPVKAGVRNLIEISMFRKGTVARTGGRSDTGTIWVDGRLASVCYGEQWHVQRIVVENPPADHVGMEFLFRGYTAIDWVSVWCDGAERVPQPLRPRAWNSPVDGRFMRIAANGKYFMLEDGTPFFPVGLGGGSALPPVAYYQDIDECDVFTRVIAPVMNARKRRYWPSRCTPKPGVIVEKEMKTIADELALSKRHGIRWILNTTDQIPGSYPPNFKPDSTDRAHQREWTLHLAKLWKDETAVFTWACCNEPRCLKGTDEQQRAWHEFISRTLREVDHNHLVGANTWYYPDAAEEHLWLLGHEPTIDWVSMHPYKMTDMTLVMHKYTDAFPKPSMVAEFHTIFDNYDPFDDAFYMDSHRVDTEGPWADRFLHAMLDGQAGVIPWYIGLNSHVFDVCGITRKIADHVDWAKFNPKPRIGLACWPYERITDEGVKKLLLALSKERGIAFDLVIKQEDAAKYQLVVKTAADLAKAEAMRDVTVRPTSNWCKYYIDYAGRVLIWVKCTKPAEVIVKNLPAGDYVVEWLAVRSGDVVQRDAATATDLLRTRHAEPGAYIIVVQPRGAGSAALEGVQLVDRGLPAAELVGPDDLCLDFVSFTREESIDAYSWLKGLLERVRMETGATLELKTPSEAERFLAGQSYVLLGDARANALAKGLRGQCLRKTPHYMVFKNPADPDRRVLQVLGSRVADILKHADALNLR